ncbi:hypothetical protein [Halobacterium sp. KA-6]|uniref:hypothetical protein n=1 Tax=Halobacterium sp. KA-6 TaxID=2896368 RepID=UPI001E44D1A1|nr:hypothetical protein [Halobacterium sp. KA-6]MCD2203854.1 hypothetical protein [Halobacterium sp. KA-6]
MSVQVASQLKEFFEEHMDGELRSIVRYDLDEVDVEHIRDDVTDQYTEEELTKAIDESRLDSLHAPLYEHSFSKDHGDLQCMITCFEHVIEMNFAIDDGVGVAVAIDAEAMDDAHGLISEARNIVLEEQ